MDLFPASASPTALASLARLACDAPSHSPPTQREEREQERVDHRYERACEIAAEAFEDCIDFRIHEWLARDENREEVQTLAVACIRQDDDLRRETLRTLVERYVESCSGRYLRQVEQEEREAEEEAAAEAAWERAHG